MAGAIDGQSLTDMMDGSIPCAFEGERQSLANMPEAVAGAITAVMGRIKGLLKTEPKHDIDGLMRHAVRANVDASVNKLQHGSEVMRQLIRHDGLLVIGAMYSLETGVVEFFDDMEAG